MSPNIKTGMRVGIAIVAANEFGPKLAVSFVDKALGAQIDMSQPATAATPSAMRLKIANHVSSLAVGLAAYWASGFVIKG